MVFRVKRLRGELFGLLTLAVTFVLATIVLNTRIDGGPGVYLSAVPLPRLVASPTGTLFLLALVLAVATVWLAYGIARSRLGMGLYAIHDDEDVAEVKGVPTLAYKMAAFTLSAAVAGIAGGIHAMYVSYVTVAETFSITVPLYVVLMSVLGGARHWLGPAVGATHHRVLALRLHRRRAGDPRPRGGGARARAPGAAAARGPRAGGARALAHRAARRGSGDLRRRGGRGLGDGLARTVPIGDGRRRGVRRRGIRRVGLARRGLAGASAAATGSSAATCGRRSAASRRSAA